MIRRLFSLVVLLALVGAGVYVWKVKGGAGDLGALGQKLGDAKVAAAVKTALALHRELKGFEITVEAEDGVVTLRGRVSGAELKAAAERIAAGVPDVRQVVNHLELGAPPAARDAGRTLGESLDDETLAAKVKVALSLNRALEASALKVVAYRRVVTLSGTATPQQRSLALAIAGDVDGVASVQDQIQVVGQAQGRREAVAAALAGNEHLRDYRIRVEERAGRMVLTGRVKSGAEKDLAGLLARGATAAPVDNRLQVLP